MQSLNEQNQDPAENEVDEEMINICKLADLRQIQLDKCYVSPIRMALQNSVTGKYNVNKIK